MIDESNLLSDVWQRLGQGAANPTHPFRTGALATIDALGQPAVRTIVLRRADEASRTLWFHTDRRSAKVAELSGRHVAWVFYDPVEKLQIRLGGSATVHTQGPAAEALWRDVPPPVRTTYQSPLPPGTPIDRPHRNVPDAGGDAGRENFAAVVTLIHAIDVVQLDPAGHGRFRLDYARQPAAFQRVTP